MSQRTLFELSESEESISSSADLPANRSPLRVFVGRKRMSVTGGLSWLESLLPCGPLLSLSKMLLDLRMWQNAPCVVICRVSGTPQRGITFRWTASAERWLASASSLWARPTVHGNYNRKGASQNSGDGTFTQLQRLKPWPRPMASDHKRGSDRPADRARHSPHIPSAVNMTMGTVGSHVNPRWLEQLVGLPIGWLEPDGPPLRKASETSGNPPPSPIV